MEQQSLFERAGASPLAARMRPQTLDEFVGQKHLLGPGKVLRRLLGRCAPRLRGDLCKDIVPAPTICGRSAPRPGEFFAGR